jgi:hypothetical protein
MPLSDPEAQQVRDYSLAALNADPEPWLAAYTATFGNILNADDAATLFPQYNQNRARYRVAIHPAATWIRDEALIEAAPKGKTESSSQPEVMPPASTAIEFVKARQLAQCIFDSTLSNIDHARVLIDRALTAEKQITLLHVIRPLDDALFAMLNRARTEGRLVTVNQLIRSRQGADETIRALWSDYREDYRFDFRFVENSSIHGARKGSIESAAPKDYTEIGKVLDAILDAELRAGRIEKSAWEQVRRH